MGAQDKPGLKWGSVEHAPKPIVISGTVELPTYKGDSDLEAAIAKYIRTLTNDALPMCIRWHCTTVTSSEDGHVVHVVCRLMTQEDK